jgi:GTP cyclohydrolase FolE2
MGMKLEKMRRSVQYSRVVEHLQELKRQHRSVRTMSLAEINRALIALRYYREATLELAAEHEKEGEKL